MQHLETLFLLSFLVLIHELGHLFAAKWMGIPVAGFSVGFGPKLYGFARGGTEYALRALPLGGYVLPRAEGLEAMREVPLLRRLVFYFGGPFANLAAAIPLFGLYNAAHGQTMFRSLFVAPFEQTARAVFQVCLALPAQLADFGQMSGVVGIVEQGGRLAEGRFLEFALALTLSLALLNLLPVPVLDGGKILFALLEKVVPASRRLEVPVTLASAVLLVALMVFLNFRDAFRWMT